MKATTYILDPNVEYREETPEVIDGEQHHYFMFRATPQDVVPLRSRRCVVMTKSGGLQFQLVKFEQIPGPPVDGKLEYKMTLIRRVPDQKNPIFGGVLP